MGLFDKQYSTGVGQGLATLADAFTNSSSRQLLGLKSENLSSRNLASQLVAAQRNFELNNDRIDRDRFEAERLNLSPDILKGYNLDREKPYNYSKTQMGDMQQKGLANVLEKFPIDQLTQEDLMNTQAGNLATQFRMPNASIASKAMDTTEGMMRGRDAMKGIGDATLKDLPTQKIKHLANLPGGLAGLSSVAQVESKIDKNVAGTSLLGVKELDVKQDTKLKGLWHNQKIVKNNVEIKKTQQEIRNLEQDHSQTFEQRGTRLLALQYKEDKLRIEADILAKTKDDQIAYEKAKTNLKQLEATLKTSEVGADFVKGSIKYNDDGTFTAIKQTTGEAVQISFAKGHNPKPQDARVIEIYNDEGTVTEHMVVSPSQILQTRNRLKNIDKAPQKNPLTRTQEQQDSDMGVVIGTKKKIGLSPEKKLKAEQSVIKANTIHDLITKSQDLITRHGQEVVGVMGKFTKFEEFLNEFNNIDVVQQANGNYVPVNRETGHAEQSPATRFAFYVSMIRSQARQMIIGEKRVSDTEQKLVDQIVNGQMLYKNPTEAMMALSEIGQINENHRGALVTALGREYTPRKIGQVQFAGDTPFDKNSYSQNSGIEFDSFPDNEKVRTEVLDAQKEYGNIHIDTAQGAYYYLDDNGRKRLIKLDGEIMRTLE